MRKVRENTNAMEVVFVLDRSGSMENVTEDTIGGFNSMIRKQKEEAVNALVTTVLFDDKINILHDRVNITDIPSLTNKDYYARGATALLDAVGSTITHISNIHKYARETDIPSKTLFVITTDGYENASNKYTLTKVKSMIEEQQSNGWEFLFLGANIDAIETAGTLGIRRECAANVICDDEGVATTYQAVSDAVLECWSAPRGSELSKKWRERLDEDLKNRSILRKKVDDNELPEFLRKK